MKFKSQLQLQACLDGELNEGERRQVESWLAQDPEAQALLTELRNTRAALAGLESDVKLPESREFYWSKIEREIRRQEQTAPRTEWASWLTGWRRLLAPVGVAAALALGLAASLQLSSGPSGRSSDLEVTLVDGDAIAYRDHAQGMTLVWFSYPADDGRAEGSLRETLQN